MVHSIYMPSGDRAEDEAAFIELIDRETDGQLDPGIRLFDSMITQTEEFLNENDVNDSEQAVIDLNGDWSFHQDIATVSGRLYLADYMLKDYLGSDLGEVIDDQDGHPYVLAENLELFSLGIVKGPHDFRFNNDEESVSTTRIGYGFSLPQDKGPYHQFVLYPGEAAQHVYTTPSIEAVDLKLHRDWPEVMGLIDKMIKRGEREVQVLPKRLELITRRIQKILLASDELREWVAMYLDNRINFDSQWSVAITMRGPILFMDEDQDVVNLDIKQSHTEHCFAPQVMFDIDESADGPVVRVMFIAKVSNPVDQNYSDTLIVPMHSIEKLRSTRRTTSLVDVALANSYSNDQDNTVIQVEQIEDEVVGHESMKHLQRQRDFQDALTNFIKTVRKVRRNSYSSLEAAELMSQKMSEEFAEYLASINASTIHLNMRGDGVALPALSAKVEADKSAMTLRVDPDNPTTALSVVSETIVYYDDIYAGVETYMVEGSSSVQYLPLPQMLVLTGIMSLDMVETPVPLVTNQVRQKALVRLDKFDAIKPAQLDYIDDLRDSFREFKKDNIAKPLIDTLNRIHEAEVALAQGRADKTKLRKNDLLTKLADQLDEFPDQASDAIDLVSKLFKANDVKMIGTVYVNGRRLDDMELAGIIDAAVEYVPSDPQSGIAFAVHVQEGKDQPIYYIPLRSITKYQF